MMRDNHPSRQDRALIGILHAGEPSLDDAIASAKAQVGVRVTIMTISGLPKWEAHRELFERFTTDAGRHDLLVKLDADMELIEPGILAASSRIVRENPRLDHIVLGVDDWLSGERIMGMSIWRSGVRWPEDPPDLFTDMSRSTARERFKLIDPGFPLVLHARQPSEGQALRYGAHRALKAARTQKSSRLDRLETFATFAATTDDGRRHLALAAVALALREETAGRRLVDGDVGPREEDLVGLRRAAEQPEQLLREIQADIAALRRSAGSLETREGQSSDQRLRRLMSRARTSLKRRLSAPPMDDELVKATFLAELARARGSDA